jgi:hypothetical protein
MANDISHRQYSDELFPVDDDEVADAPLNQLLGRPLEAPVGRRRDDALRYVIGDLLGVGVLAAADRVEDSLRARFLIQTIGRKSLLWTRSGSRFAWKGALFN